MENSSVRFKIAEQESEKEAIYAFRYKVYVEEMGKSLVNADHDRKFLKDAQDDVSVQFYLEDDNGVFACIRGFIGGDEPFTKTEKENFALDKFSEYGDNSISITGKLMIDAKKRNSPALGILLCNVYRYGRERGVKFDFCNCAPSLVQLYEMLGYRRYKDSISDPDVGYRIVLVNVLEDIQHLRFVKSPFYRLAQSLNNQTDTSDWFAKNFKVKIKHIHRNLLDEEEIWKYFSSALGDGGIHLLEGFTDKEKESLMSQGTLINVNKGKTITQKGNWGESLYIILTGRVEMFVHEKDQHFSLGYLGQGEVFGLSAYVNILELTNTVAVEHTQLLELSKFTYLKLSVNQLKLTNKLNNNLLKILTGRFAPVTDEWLSSTQQTKK